MENAVLGSSPVLVSAFPIAGSTLTEAKFNPLVRPSVLCQLMRRSVLQQAGVAGISGLFGAVLFQLAAFNFQCTEGEVDDGL